MLKIANQLLPASDEILTANKIEELVMSLITAEQKELLLKEKSLVFGYTFTNGLRFKINLFYQKGSLAAGLRFISPHIMTIQELGLPKSIERIIELKSGLVIISGPINSGKSTTLSAIIEYLNANQQLRIVTLEKPIEFIFTNQKSIVQQREVGKDTPSFKEGLKDCVESSLDVVAISQVENKDEVEQILELAQQGRLVLFNTNANSVSEVILKLLSFFDEEEHGHMRGILSRVLQAVVCQQLVSNKNGALVVVPEILFHTEAVRLAIQDNKLNQINNILRTSIQQGMISFEQSLAGLVKQGIVTEEEALKHVEDRESFRQMVI
jgi:twitching motility protein PilT